MASPPQNIGSDAEDGEVSASGDETVGKEDAQDSSATSALPVGQSEEENGEDPGPQRKVFFPQRCISIYFNSTLLYFKLTNSYPGTFCYVASLFSHTGCI